MQMCNQMRLFYINVLSHKLQFNAKAKLLINKFSISNENGRTNKHYFTMKL